MDNNRGSKAQAAPNAPEDLYEMLSIFEKYRGLDDRSKRALNNALLSLLMKGVSMMVSLLIVPMTLNYVNSTRYGVWMAISSIISWIAFFDLGLGNGMRNKFAEAKASGNDLLAKQYVSTTYMIVAVIVVALYAIMLLLNGFVDWAGVLKIDFSYSSELHNVFIYISLFACLNLFASLLPSFLAAEQRPGIASLVSAAGQIISLLVLYLLTKFTEGNLVNLAMFYSGIPCVTLLFAALLIFHLPAFHRYSPSLKCFRIELVKDTMSLGLQFFVIYLALIFVFQITSLVISRELGPDAVTQFSIVEKFFNVLYMTSCIALTPFWSGYTDAYVRGDKEWMFSTMKRLEKFLMAVVTAGVVMLLASKLFYRIWIGNSVVLPFSLSVVMFFYAVFRCMGNMYNTVINGIGTIRLQTIVYVISAVFAWPMITLSCRLFGVCGAALFPSLVCLVQAVVSRIQIFKLLNDRAAGIWLK